MRTILCILFLLMASWSFGQQPDLPKPRQWEIRLGVSAFSISPLPKYPLRETNLTHSVSVSPFRRLYVGVRWSNIWVSGERVPSARYFAWGPFGQYYLGLNDKFQVFGGLGMRFCNMALVGRQVPFRRKNQVFLSVSGGFDIQIYRDLRLELGYVTHPVLNGLKGQFGDNYPIVGLDWRIK